VVFKSGREVVEDRDTRYKGGYSSRATVSQKMKEVVRESTYWGELSYVEKEAVDEIIRKLARIVGGEQDRYDSWVDAAGYAQLVLREKIKDMNIEE